MSRLAVLLAAAVLCWAPAGTTRAQPADTPQAIYNSFEALLGSREQRELYALPPERYWRATGPLRVRLAGAESGLVTAFVALTGDLARATGIKISVKTPRLATLPEPDWDGELAILIVSRGQGFFFGARLGLDEEMLRRFADRSWPALFRFRRDDFSPQGRRTGTVLLADDLKPTEIEAFVALAMIWTLGGASIGDDLGEIVSISDWPRLTERGRRVFVLMYQPELRLAQPLDQTRTTARRLLGLQD